ncbi:MAG TPA: tyrosine/phenylalanine carboxypeptidase domain-containing protein, partial [Ktedonobacteraceae bacterium]|nr:tyrosine/phenylalanine carboxypeptidase domain-containing protein [Ktedonobacteraceae bacterium]
ILTGAVILPANIELHVTHRLILHEMQALHFLEAHKLLSLCCDRLDERFPISLLEDQALLCNKWSDYVSEQGDIQEANDLQERAITLYRECCTKLATKIAEAPLSSTRRKHALGQCLNDLSCRLNRAGRYEEALQAVEEALIWREQGYVEFGGLAASYGEKSQILMELGRFQESLFFDEKAVAEVERCAKTGHSSSQEEVWTYRVNRGRLYLRIGKIDEAERLLREAIPHISKRRRIYRMYAEDTLKEIEQWRQKTTTSHYQLDWRWVERYRQLVTYDAYGWWWAQAGPFTEEEQHQWEQFYTPNPDETIRAQLGELISRSCRRELRVAVAEQRQPRLHYPALDGNEIRRRIVDMQHLAIEISQEEPNAIVRRLYQGALEEEMNFLGMIVATQEGNTERYKNLHQRFGFAVTDAEMNEVLSRLKPVLQQGLRHPEANEVSQRLLQWLQEHCQVSFDLFSEEEAMQEVVQNGPTAASPPLRMITAQAAKRFFEAVLRESGYEDWHVVIDPTTTVGRVESAARLLFLPSGTCSSDYLIIHLFAHEFVGHITRSVAGERSLLGLLGIGTKGHMAVEEGFAVYHQRQVAALRGKALENDVPWFGTLATGLASGVVTPPQTFVALFTFFELFHLLLILLKEPELERQTAQNRARNRAFTRCLRTYRGVPDLEQAGVWYGVDVSYLRGLRLIERAIAEDATVLDRLAVGKIALEDLPDMQELGIIAAAQPLKKLAYDPALESYIVSFEEPAEA